MAKLPGIADLGPVATPDPTRPVGSYDVSAIARGGQAMAQGAEHLGAGLNEAGQGVSQLVASQSRWQHAMAQSGQLADTIDLHQQLANDQNYGPDENGNSMPDRYAAQATAIRDKWAATIQNPAMRDRFSFELAAGDREAQDRRRRPRAIAR